MLGVSDDFLAEVVDHKRNPRSSSTGFDVVIDHSTGLACCSFANWSSNRSANPFSFGDSARKNTDISLDVATDSQSTIGPLRFRERVRRRLRFGVTAVSVCSSVASMGFLLSGNDPNQSAAFPAGVSNRNEMI